MSVIEHILRLRNEASPALKATAADAAEAEAAVRAVGDAADQAAAGQDRAATSAGRLGDQAGRVGANAAKLAGGLSSISPAAGGAAMAVADMADAVEVAEAAAVALGVEVGTLLAAVLPVAAAVAALALAWRHFATEAEAAEGRMKASAEAAERMAGAVARLRVAEEELALKAAILSGEVGPEALAGRRAQIEAEAAYAEVRSAALERQVAVTGELAAAERELASERSGQSDRLTPTQFRELEGRVEILRSTAAAMTDELRGIDAQTANAAATLLEWEGRAESGSEALRGAARDMAAVARQRSAFLDSLPSTASSAAQAAAELRQEMERIVAEAERLGVPLALVQPALDQLRRSAELAAEALDFEAAMAPLAAAPAAVTALAATLDRLAEASVGPLDAAQALRRELDALAQTRADVALAMSRGQLTPEQAASAESTITGAESAARSTYVASVADELAPVIDELDRMATEMQNQQVAAASRGMGVATQAATGDMGAVAGAAANAVMGPLGGVIGQGLGALAAIGEAGPKAIEAKIDAWGENAARGLAALPQIAQALIEALVKLPFQLIAAAPEMIVNAIQSAWELLTFGDAIRDWWDGMGGWSGIVRALLDWFKEIWATVKEFLNPFDKESRGKVKDGLKEVLTLGFADTRYDRYDIGGYIPRTGPAIVHEGERIVPASGSGGSQATAQAAQGGGGDVHIHIHAGMVVGDMRELHRELLRAMRTHRLAPLT